MINERIDMDLTLHQLIMTVEQIEKLSQKLAGADRECLMQCNTRINRVVLDMLSH